MVIDLKLGKLSHADVGQMHLYLNYAREHWARPGENPPVGLILCADRRNPMPASTTSACPCRAPPSARRARGREAHWRARVVDADDRWRSLLPHAVGCMPAG